MADKLHELFLKVKIGNVMNKTIVTVYEDENLSVAQEKFIAHTASHILVLDRRDRLSGLISQKYLYKTYSPRRIINENIGIDKNIILDGDSYFDKNSLDGYILRTAMKKSPFSMKSSDLIIDAIYEMDRQNLGCVPIVDKERRVEGVLTNHDIVKFVAYILSEAS